MEYKISSLSSSRRLEALKAHASQEGAEAEIARAILRRLASKPQPIDWNVRVDRQWQPWRPGCHNV